MDMKITFFYLQYISRQIKMFN